MQRSWMAVAIVIAVGCDSKQDAPVPSRTPASPAPPRSDGALPIRFGDCTPTPVQFVSGPKPAAFDPAKLPPPPTPGAPRPTTQTTTAETRTNDASIYGDLSDDGAGVLPGDTLVGYPTSGGGDLGVAPSTYGRIGHGAGTGSAPNPSSKQSSVSMGNSSTTGRLDKNVIRRVVRRDIAQIQYCYEKELLRDPTLMGTLMASFTIGPGGDVVDAQATGVSPAVASCVRKVIEKLKFPAVEAGTVGVSYPFTFRPAGAPPPSSWDAPASAPPPAPPPPPVHLYRGPGQVDATYQPGATNPLRAQEAALAECLRAGTQRAGVAVVDLGADPVVHGLESGVATCVVEVARKMTQPGARCSFAYGELPLSALPAIEITAGGISFGGKQIATTQQLLDQPSWEPSISPLTNAILERVDAVTAPDGPAVSIHGPLLIKALPETPMRVVYRVMGSVLRGGDDLVFAKQVDTDWQLLTPLPLPVVPVPLGTGGVRNHVKAWVFAEPATAQRTVLSVLVAHDKISLALSGNKAQELGRDPQALATALAGHKASADFASRTDLEIAAMGTATYAELLAVIGAAVKAGFTDWQLTTPTQLTTYPAVSPSASSPRP